MTKCKTISRRRALRPGMAAAALPLVHIRTVGYPDRGLWQFSQNQSAGTKL